DESEKQQAVGKQSAARFFGQQQDVFEARERIQFALAGMTRPEPIGQFGNGERARHRRQYVDQYLRPDAGEPRRNLVQNLTAQHEKPADRVADLGVDQQTAKSSTVLAEPLSPAIREPLGAAVFDIAAGDDEIGAAESQVIEHSHQQRLVVLQIAVDDR